MKLPKIDILYTVNETEKSMALRIVNDNGSKSVIGPVDSLNAVPTLAKMLLETITSNNMGYNTEKIELTRKYVTALLIVMHIRFMLTNKNDSGEDYPSKESFKAKEESLKV